MKALLLVLSLTLTGCLMYLHDATDPNVSNRCPNKCLGNGQWLCCEVDGGPLR